MSDAADSVQPSSRAKRRFVVVLDDATHEALRRRAQAEYPKSMTRIVAEAVAEHLRKPPRRTS